jgi:hypothetical protein
MHRIVQSGVAAHTALEATRGTIDLTEQLNLEPALVTLNRIGWCERSAQFGNPNEIHGSDEINKSLRNAHERTDLANRL